MAKAGSDKGKPVRKLIGVKLNQDLWRRLKILALKQDRTAGELLEEAD